MIQETRQWYGRTVKDTLAAFLLALQELRDLGSAVLLGPWDPDEIAAVGFWARGTGKDLDAFEGKLDLVAKAAGLQIASVHVAGGPL